MHLLKIIALLTMFIVQASAGPVGLARLDRLVEQASAIVVARSLQGSQSGSIASVVLEVDRTLKGSIAPGVIAVEITTSEEFASRRDLGGLRGIWFLSADPGGKIRVLPAMLGSVPLEFFILPSLPSLPASWKAADPATPIENVLRELAAALEQNGASSFPFAAEFLVQLPADSGPTLKGLYTRMSTSLSAAVSSAGLAGLIKSGDASALGLAKASLAQLRAEIASPVLAQAVCEYFNGNVKGLELLSELASTPQKTPRVRECAAHAMRNVHSRESLPFLLRLLNSEDQLIRYEAVAGIASYANSGFIPNEKPLRIDGVQQQRLAKPLWTQETADNFPTLSSFKEDETRVVFFWRRWLEENLGIQ